MDWDDEYDNGYNDMDYTGHREESMPEKDAEAGLDPTDIVNPVSAYFFLRDDAQDEISGSDKKKMKCKEILKELDNDEAVIKLFENLVFHLKAGELLSIK